MQHINEARLLDRIHALGRTGLDAAGRRVRLAATDEDKAGRDLLAQWITEAGLTVVTDCVGNQFGIWQTEENKDREPVMLGSHIDSVINAGQYDGCTGVLGGLEVIQTLMESGAKPARPLAVGAFTDEEGVRFAPDMLGSLVYVGGLDVDTALDTVGVDGKRLGDELRRIGYAGTAGPLFIRPHAFVELHIEQGPILDAEGVQIGAVEDLQGISWSRITINGAQNHAGTTPIAYRRDAGVAAAKVIAFMRERCCLPGSRTVATTGCIAFTPNATNVIPSRAVFTMDIRNPDEMCLRAEEAALAAFLNELEQTDRVTVSVERMSRFEPVKFDEGIVRLVEKYAAARGLSCRRMTSGAGQDAQMLARVCPTAMIFVPSVNGVSHNPEELTRDADVVNGANLLLDVASELAGL